MQSAGGATVNCDGQKKFDALREKYVEFIYRDFSIEREGDFLCLRYDFEIPGLCEFHPENKIRISRLELANSPFSEDAKRAAFSLGMAELISYWKTACPKRLKILCGSLTAEELFFFRKLYFYGLGEFFYKNNIKTDIDSFMEIECISEKAKEEGGQGSETRERQGELNQPDGPGSQGSQGRPAGFNRSYGNDGKDGQSFNNKGFCIVPMGGGKDSAVTAELLAPLSDKLYCFTVNDQPAREQTARCAGCGEERLIRTYRTLDENMLRLNREGFLNGHTPFSAVVAFLSYYCAFITGSPFIVLSNEASANESNIRGEKLNHQYSKSYEFEKDFRNYTRSIAQGQIDYFSLLRPFNELQIAKQFAELKKYHGLFRSCNVGSKKNIWCCSCPKCLFVYIILSPFLSPEELCGIFGENLLEKESLREAFDALTGAVGVKPFECVGTAREINAALSRTAEKYERAGLPLPRLMTGRFGEKAFGDRICGEEASGEEASEEKASPSSDFSKLLDEFNDENSVPEKFRPFVEKMYAFVREEEKWE